MRIFWPAWPLKGFGIFRFFRFPLSAACLISAAGAAHPASPNIIYILTDDLGYGDLGSYGQAKIRTPRLDGMAREGMRFTDHYAGNAVCAPSRAALLTGLHMGHAHIRANQEVPGGQKPLPAEAITVAEVLKAKGYATACIGKWGLGTPGSVGHPNRQGFDLFYGYLDQVHAHNYYPDSLWRNAAAERLAGKPYSADLFAAEALAYVKQNRSRPFFLFLALTTPHAQLQVPSVEPYAAETWRDVEKRYAAMITRMDRDVGALLDSLGRWGLDSNTVVMFASDNGPSNEGGNDTAAFNNNGPLRGLKRDVYDGGIRVPFLARWPGRIAAGAVSPLPSYFPDFLPTACELAGTAAPEGLDGLSFAPTLLGQASAQKVHPHLYWEFNGDGRNLTAGRMGKWKAVKKAAAGAIELYDLSVDIDESDNLAARNPAQVTLFQNLFQSAHTDASPLIRMPPVSAIRAGASEGGPDAFAVPGLRRQIAPGRLGWPDASRPGSRVDAAGRWMLPEISP